MTVDHELARKVARAELSKRALFVLIGIVGGAIVLTQIFLLFAIRGTQNEGTPTGRRIVALSQTTVDLQRTINDCVNPEGKCYQRSRDNQADVVATLNLGALYAVYCVDRNPQADIEDIQRCVKDLYDARNKKS